MTRPEYLVHMASEAVILPVDGPHGAREVRISSPGRILWPEPGISKLDLARYIVGVGVTAGE